MVIREPVLLTPFAWEVLSAIWDGEGNETVLPHGHMPTQDI